jgi:hypothetical protein
MLAHGFSTDMLLDLVKAGLATASTECMGTGGRQTNVTHVRISEAGQRTGSIVRVHCGNCALPLPRFLAGVRAPPESYAVFKFRGQIDPREPSIKLDQCARIPGKLTELGLRNYRWRLTGWQMSASVFHPSSGRPDCVAGVRDGVSGLVAAVSGPLGGCASD